MINLTKINASYAKEAFPITDRELKFGVEHGLATFADTPESYDMPLYSDQLAQAPSEFDLWRYIFIYRAIESNEKDSDLFNEIDSIYDDFDFPADMRPIASHTPIDEAASDTGGLKERIIRYSEGKRQELLAARGF